MLYLTPGLKRLVTELNQELEAGVDDPAVEGRLRRALETRTPAAFKACAEDLVRRGDIDRAEEQHRDLIVAFPKFPSGWLGLVDIEIRRGDWGAAEARMAEFRTRFPTKDDVYIRMFDVRLLEGRGQFDEARRMLQAMIADFPDNPLPGIGLGYLCWRTRDYAAALAAYENLGARFPQHVNGTKWRTMCAKALGKLRRHELAIAAFSDVLASGPVEADTLAGFAAALADAGRLEEACAAVANSPLKDHDIKLRVLYIHLLRAGQTYFARDEFDRALEEAANVADLAALVNCAPYLFEGDAHERRMRRILEKLGGASIAASPDASQSPRIVRARALLAANDREGALQAVDGFDAAERATESGKMLAAIADAARGADPALRERPKVFGIGMPKTATSTLSAALHELGYSSLHFINPLTGKIIDDDDVAVFDAFADAPICERFERYYEAYPNAKFIYSVRDAASLKASTLKHWRRFLGAEDFAALTALDERGDALSHGRRLSAIHHALYLKYRDLDEAIAAYDHRVRAFFADKPKDKLLEFDVFRGDGWAELCGFLGKPLPATPFPHENATSS